MWKTLRHQNVLSLLGVTMTKNPNRFVMVSEWMEYGSIHKFIKVHPHANRLALVCFFRSGSSSSLDMNDNTIIIAYRHY